MKFFFDAFYAWLSLLAHHHSRTFYFWYCLTPRFLDCYHSHDQGFFYPEDYPAIPAWNYKWTFTGKSWQLIGDLDEIPF